MVSSYTIGKMYFVPCLFIAPDRRPWWMPKDGWVPTIGPKHSDAEHLEFPHEHYHIDWRFVGTVGFRLISAHKSAVHGSVITSDFVPYRIDGKTELKRRMCKRAMPEFPARLTRLYKMADGRQDARWAALEQAQREACPKLKPGNICPHRGIDLTPFIKPDGTVICPGHGLMWDTKTGDLLKRHCE